MSSRRSRQKDKRRNDRLREQATTAASEGRLEEAERLLRRAIERAPGNARYWRDLAVLLTTDGRGDEAEHAWRKCLALAPDFAEARQALGVQEPEAVDADESSEPGNGADPELPRTSRYDWSAAADELTGRGATLLTGIVTAEDRTELEPLARELYWQLARVANEWMMSTRRAGFPPDMTHLRRRHPELPEVLTLDIEPSEDEELRMIPEGISGFPFRVALALEPKTAATFLFGDARSGRHGRHRAYELETGDALVFATRFRPVQIGGAWGLQGMSHGAHAGAPASLLVLDFDPPA